MHRPIVRGVVAKAQIAVSFNGVDAYVDCGDRPGLNFGANVPFTVAGWVKTTTAYGPIFSQRSSKDESSVLNLTVGFDGKTVDPGKLMAMVRQDGAGNSHEARVSGGLLNDGNWHAFALTRSSGGVIELFLDGSSQGADSSTHSAGAITTDLRAIGSERLWARINFSIPARRYFNGSVGDLRIYDRALSAPEIRALATP